MIERAYVLQHAAGEGPGAIATVLAELDAVVRVVRIDRGEPVPREPDCDALIVLGGPMGVYEQDRHPHLVDELRLVERVLAAGRPVLGVCLGSQIVATVLGAEVRASGAFELGWLPLEIHAPGRAALGADPLVALHWHGDVFDPPPGTEALASSAMTPCQAFAAGRALGLLFHLEPDVAQVRAMASAFPEDLRRAGLDLATLLETTARHVDAAHERLRAIVRRWASA